MLRESSAYAEFRLCAMEKAFYHVFGGIQILNVEKQTFMSLLPELTTVL